MASWKGHFDDFNSGNGYPSKSQNNQRHSFNGNSDTTSNSSKVTEILKIYDISSSHSYVTIIGLVICKDGPKSIISKKGTERYLLALTVRDAEESFINVTSWGNESYIQSAAQLIQIGDVVQVSNAQVQSKPNNGMDDKYKPTTPSPYQLNISENHGNIELYSGWDSENFRGLQHLPTKPKNDYYTLEDINVNGMSLQGEHINILAAVKKLGKVRDITTKTGKMTKKCEVLLFDETCSNFTLDLWNINVEQAQTWIAHQTVIFAADVKIIHSDFKSSMIAVADSKTIFTVDPETTEAYSLHSYAMSDTSWTNDTSNEGENVKFVKEIDPDLESIKEIYTIEQMKTKCNNIDFQADYGVAFVFLSKFDIDSEDHLITRQVCNKCRRTMKEESNFICLNPSCSGDEDNAIFQNKNALEYNISVSISDHTGTLDFCQLQSTAAENILGFKADNINEVNLDKLTQIKWNYLLERCKIKFKIKKFNSRISVRVLSLMVADHNEVHSYFSSL
ncbi:hypothetical protein SNE40_019038 [Patella caerulea]|uniref:Replication protein A subunit n=1 Tax=Patella caerulea TaxID=87958 RepID=A0AAN8J5Y9_PATCE